VPFRARGSLSLVEATNEMGVQSVTGRSACAWVSLRCPMEAVHGCALTVVWAAGRGGVAVSQMTSTVRELEAMQFEMEVVIHL
jgi:hypothetical protein